MRGVAGVFPLHVSAATFLAAIVVAAVWVGGALYVAERIVSSNAPAPPQSAGVAPAQSEPMQTPNRAKKEAREAFKPRAKRHALLEPEVVVPQPEIVTPLPEEDGEDEEAPAETGRASWYELSGATASGEEMDAAALTAAHPSLPLGSHARVTNLENGRVVVVRINDRGPYARDRIIDLSKAAAAELGMVEAGVARVSVTPVALLAAR